MKHDKIYVSICIHRTLVNYLLSRRHLNFYNVIKVLYKSCSHQNAHLKKNNVIMTQDKQLHIILLYDSIYSTQNSYENYQKGVGGRVILTLYHLKGVNIHCNHNLNYTINLNMIFSIPCFMIMIYTFK